MSAWLTDVIPAVLRGSVFLAVATLVASWLCAGKRYPRLQRFVWLAVLVQGLILIRFDLPTAWLPTEAQRSVSELQLPQANFSADFHSLVGQKPSTQTSSDLGPSGESGTTPNFVLVVGLVWLVGMLTAFVWQGLAYICFLRSVEYTDTPPEWTREWEEACHALQLPAGTTIAATTNAGPLVYRARGGYRLLVPVSQWAELTESQRATVLCHEASHILRRDVWKSVIVRLLALPHWFNPLAWLAVRRFEDCAEWACDDLARASMPDAMSDYARALLDLGQRPAKAPAPVSAANGRPLVERIQRVLTPTGKDTLMKTKALIAIVAVGLLTALNSVRMAEAGQEPSPDRKALDVPSDDNPQTPKAATQPNTQNVEASHQMGIDLSAVLPKQPLAEKESQAVIASDTVDREVTVAGKDEAVIDLAKVFEAHPRFKNLREQLQKEIQASDQRARQLAGTSEFGKFRAQAQKGLMARESKIYLSVFRSIQAEVAAYAREHGIRLVRRAKTHVPGTGTEEERLTPKQVVELMNRPIVFIDNQPRDITRDIIDRIQKKEQKRATAIGVPLLRDLPALGPVFRRVQPGEKVPEAMDRGSKPLDQ